jgi:hypothetical protein
MARTTFTVELKGVDQLRNSFESWPQQAFLDTREILKEEEDKTVEKMAFRSSKGPLIKKSGQLSRRWGDDVSGNSLSRLRGTVFSPVSYSAIHELGGVRRAKGSSWFFIPTRFNQKKVNSAGSITALKSVRKVIDEGGRFAKAWQVAEYLKERLEYVTGTMVVDNRVPETPMFTMVKVSKYAPVLGLQVVGAETSKRLVDRVGKQIIEPLRG